MWQRIVICGMGVMGASLGHTLLEKGLARQVIGLVRRANITGALVDQKLCHSATTEAGEALPEADLVILASPVRVIAGQLKSLLPFLKQGVLVTDVGSVKQDIVLPCTELVGGKGTFIGSHPMTGTEKFGFENFIPNLYRGMPCILTPTSDTPQAELDRLKQFWQKTGARVEVMSPAQHDHCVGFISHLPHVVSFALMKCLVDQKEENPFLFDLAGGSFRDMTRIAGSSPDIWTDIFAANQQAVLKSIDVFQDKIAWLKERIRVGETAAIHQFLSNMSQARQEFSSHHPSQK